MDRMDGFKYASREQFQGVEPPRAHSADDNFNGRVQVPEGPSRVYREPATAGDDSEPGAAWQPSTLGTGRPVTPLASGYMKPIITR